MSAQDDIDDLEDQIADQEKQIKEAKKALKDGKEFIEEMERLKGTAEYKALMAKSSRLSITYNSMLSSIPKAYKHIK